MPTDKHWRMEKPCPHCPFAIEMPPGEFFTSARWEKLQRDLLRGAHFVCHKTTRTTGNGDNLICAGAIDWQAERGVVADYVQICQRLDIINARSDRR